MTQDFSGRNLQGRCFKNQDLTAANFCHADIRGADFTNTILKDANFSYAKAGLQRRWATALFIISLILSVLSGFIAAWAGMYAGSKLADSELTISARIFTIILMFAVFCSIAAIRQGIGAGLRTVGLTMLLIIQLAIALNLVLTVTGSETEMVGVAMAVNRAGTLAGVVAATWTLIYTLGGSVAVAGATSGAISVFGTIGGTVAWAVAGTTAGVLAVIGGLKVAGYLPATVVFAGVSTLLGGYIAIRITAGDEKFSLIRRLVVVCNTTGGTNFQGADLTEANFTQAILKNTTLSNAILNRTCWFHAKKVNLARVDGTILTDSAVQDLVVTKNGDNKSFVGRSLKGANLAGADLCNANLTEADISQATLQQACLEGANLTKTQALGTNFNKAKFTGACLEAWNVDNTTQLDQVDCDYVYLLNNQQERRPSSGKFASGDFTKLFQEVLHTVDLIFRNGIDWKAFTYSFKKLQVENEDIELSIQSIETKGDGVVIVKVNVPADDNKAKLHSEFTQNYQVALEAVKERYQAELKSKDEQIAIYRQHQADLQEAIKLIAIRPVSVLETSKQVEGKLALIKISKGDFKQGFPVTLRIGVEGTLPFTETVGELSSNPALLRQYKRWQTAYQKTLKAYFRLDVPATQVTNISRSEFTKVCHEQAEVLRKQLNSWLNCQQFRSIKERLLEQLMTTEEIRVI